ncbi:MAG: hypothetical protein JJU45_08600 [Acidimicrobiia bacterium]|nr:hypothetical protein [Acidimicrobiia bacterium]
MVLLVCVALLLAACATSTSSSPLGTAAGGSTAEVQVPGTIEDTSWRAGLDPQRAVSLTLAARVTTERAGLLPIGGEGAVEPYRTGPGANSPEVIPPPPLATGSGALYAVGDSVLLGAEPYLRTTLAGWDARIDARVSRGVPEGFGLVRTNRDRIGDVLVVVLGHNYGGGGFPGWLDSLLAEHSHLQRIVLVTVAEWSSAQPEVNAAIRRAPARYPNVVVADWEAVLAANPGFLWDHVHPNRSGAIALANLIAVMVGPAPSPDGSVVARPHLLAIPPVGSSASGGSSSGSGSSGSGGSSSGSTGAGSGTTSTTGSSSGSGSGSGGGSGSGSGSGSTTTVTSVPSSSTSSVAPSSSSTTAPATTAAPTTSLPAATAPPTTASPTTTAAPPPPSTTAPPAEP